MARGLIKIKTFGGNSFYEHQDTKRVGVKRLMFTSDNFNQWSQAQELMRAMIEARINLPSLVQCTTVLWRDEAFWDLAARAGCSKIFFGIESVERKLLRSEHKDQNYPEKYPELVRLGKKYRIAMHFSNMIGFLGQDRAGVEQHLQAILDLDPDFTSWYIVTPIPGTEDYARMRQEKIWMHPDLSLYDCSHAVFQHPQFREGELSNLLFYCYCTFYAYQRGVRHCWQHLRDRGAVAVASRLAIFAFYRWSAWHCMHPMSGGVWQVKLDREDDYQSFRQEMFGLRGLFPLPDNCPLTARDLAMSRLVNPTLPAKR